jgi:hypothetical protein
VHVAMDDLKHSIAFYSALFAAEPSVDAGRSARQFCYFDARSTARP